MECCVSALPFPTNQLCLFVSRLSFTSSTSLFWIKRKQGKLEVRTITSLFSLRGAHSRTRLAVLEGRKTSPNRKLIEGRDWAHWCLSLTSEPCAQLGHKTDLRVGTLQHTALSPGLVLRAIKYVGCTSSCRGAPSSEERFDRFTMSYNTQKEVQGSKRALNVREERVINVQGQREWGSKQQHFGNWAAHGWLD